MIFTVFPKDRKFTTIILMANPIILEAVIGLVTAFNIKTDVNLCLLALIASICIDEDFAAGEVAFIMQLGALLEDLTVAKARAGKGWRADPGTSKGETIPVKWRNRIGTDFHQSGSYDRMNPFRLTRRRAMRFLPERSIS
ncbi:MAG: hypothetical protein V8Q25_02330 [Roseburia faecis]